MIGCVGLEILKLEFPIIVNTLNINVLIYKNASLQTMEALFVLWWGRGVLIN
jgi:hypothetical protein